MKCFIAIFVFFSVKAIYFELVSDLMTESFLGARRGCPNKIYSDNGTNFVGVNHELEKFIRYLFTNKEEIDNYLASEAIKWHFDPPSAPHFGGLWEAWVKSLKFYLWRVIGDTALSYEEFVFVQVEAVLNSRPLCPLSSDLEVIMSIHVLIGSSLLKESNWNYDLILHNRLNH